MDVRDVAKAYEELEDYTREFFNHDLRYDPDDYDDMEGLEEYFASSISEGKDLAENLRRVLKAQTHAPRSLYKIYPILERVGKEARRYERDGTPETGDDPEESLLATYEWLLSRVYQPLVTVQNALGQWYGFSDD